MLEKLGAVVGASNLHIYAAMRGETLDEFRKTRTLPERCIPSRGATRSALGQPGTPDLEPFSDRPSASPLVFVLGPSSVVWSKVPLVRSWTKDEAPRTDQAPRTTDQERGDTETKTALAWAHPRSKRPISAAASSSTMNSRSGCLTVSTGHEAVRTTCSATLAVSSRSIDWRL